MECAKELSLPLNVLFQLSLKSGAVEGRESVTYFQKGITIWCQQLSS